jgi:spore coat protein A
MTIHGESKMNARGCWRLVAFAAGLLVAATPALAQVFPPPPPLAVPLARLPFPPQNPFGPTGAAQQTNYPYPGQCVVDFTNNGNWGVPACNATNAKSFACEPTGSFSNASAGGWRACGPIVPFKILNPIVAASVPVVVGTPPTPKFQWEVLNPPDYTPDTTKFPGADYYEIGVHEAWGFQTLAGLGLFPNPLAVGGIAVPNGMQWTGLICNVLAGCTCPAELSATFAASYCPGGVIPAGKPLFTPIWGVGQKNTPVTAPLYGVLKLPPPATRPEYSPNDYVATWPSISIRAHKGTPVVVRWVNEFPNNHVFCPHPEAADWPCAIDRTFMGVKARIDPATEPPGFAAGLLTTEGVNQFGSPQQPDNSWVTHLHGGEIPPGTDGFAEKWFGNVRTGSYYSQKAQFLSPAFEGPHIGALYRPGGDPAPSGFTAASSWMNDTYSYPMVQDEATIWFHDHTLGKTHHNVIAGPAGFFPVIDDSKHGTLAAGVCTPKVAGGNCSLTWLDPLTEPRDAVTSPKYDLFLALQDRSFNDDGSINFSNGLGNPVVPLVAPFVTPPGTTPVTNGVNPQVHPVWVPEYFGDHALVNGVLWPKKSVEPGWYRIRLVNGSDSRCWTLGLSTVLPAPGVKPKNDMAFNIIANDQGYLPTPVLNQTALTMCPGERYELLVNFGVLPGKPTGLPRSIVMTNSAAAPFPAGITPFVAGSPFAEMNVVMRFDVAAPNVALGVPTCGVGGLTNWPPVAALPRGCLAIPAVIDPAFVDFKNPLKPLPMCLGAVSTLAAPCVSAVRQVYLNERLDGTTTFPLGMQLNGVPFEYKVTETPRKGTLEIWKFINLTVDAHPMHPHLVKHQIVETQTFNVGKYKTALCGSTTCQPGTAPGPEMQVVPDVTPFLTNKPVLNPTVSYDGGWKDASVALPGQVTTIAALWDGGWVPASAGVNATAPGTSGGPVLSSCPGAANCATTAWTYDTVTSGPYVWHCHINSHEDSEMMRTSLVVP